MTFEFAFGNPLVVNPFSFRDSDFRDRALITFQCLLVSFCVLEIRLGNCHIESPTGLNRSVVCTPFAANTSILPTTASCQGNCLSLSFLLLSFGVALDLGRVIYFASSLGMPLCPRSCSIVPGIFIVSPSLDLKRYVKRIFFFRKLNQWSEVGQSGHWFSEPERNCFFRPFPLS